MASEELMGDRLARATRRYLDLLRAALLDEHYLDNELRIAHLLDSAAGGREADPKKLANPARHMANALRDLKQERDAGDPPGGRGNANDSLAYAGLGRIRLEHLEACLHTVRDDQIAGDLVDAGTGRGGAAIFMRGFLEAFEIAGPRVWIADRFDGREPADPDAQPTFPPDLNTVRDAFASFGLLDERVVFLQGPPADGLAEAPIDQIALLRVSPGGPEEARSVLQALYDRVVPGGFVVVDTYGASDAQAAIDAFRAERGVAEPLERIDWSGAVWRKTPHEAAEPPRLVRDEPAASKHKELAVVVVVHNMRREASRTLHSLSRSYQRGVGALDYEVIVIENGSGPEQRLGEEFVRAFGEQFRYMDLGPDAMPSPARAVNRGIAATDAPVVALMIDGAHVVTPGVLRYGMLGLDTYAPAIVTAKQWYLGPGQQPQTVAAGYDQELEDRLFDEVGWPADGYRLFEIGHFIGDRDWFDGEWESNCIFVPRALIEQVGGMDESFSTPGGGFVNLDFFERMVGAPGITLVTMLGEGSFHQVHGGTTTNITEPHALVRSYDDQYEELRGRRFQVPPQRAHFVGSLPPAARRTKPRRMASFQHFRNAHAGAAEGRPMRQMPVPQDLKNEFIDAFWRSGEWHRTAWLGKWTHRPPTDLLAYQELISRLRPDWIVETRTGAGGRALFLASICDLVASGQVLSIDNYPLADPPDHPRITYLRGDPAAEDIAAQAREIMGESRRCMVVLGGGARIQLLGAFRNYAPLVPVGSYVVVEDTILEGNPVWPDFGGGPASAVNEIVDEGEFVPDPSLERFALTFNPGGFLKRVR